MEKEQDNNKIIADEKTIELLNAETDLAEKNLQKHGLSLQVLIFAVGVLIWLFMSSLYSIDPITKEHINIFSFANVVSLYMALILIWFLFLTIFLHINTSARNKRPLISMEHLSKVSYSLLPSHWLISLLYTSTLGILWLFLPFANISYVGMPISFVCYAIMFFLFFKLNIIYTKKVSYLIYENKYKYLDFLFSIIFIIGTMLSVYACFKEIDLTMLDVKYSFILFAITYLVDKILSSISKEGVYNTAIQIRRDFLSSRINEATVRKRLRFFITGETNGEALESEIQYINESLRIVRTTMRGVNDVLLELPQYIDKKSLTKEKVESIFSDILFLFNSINWKKSEIEKVTNELKILEKDFKKYNYDFRFQLGETPAPFQIHIVLLEMLSAVREEVNILERQKVNLFNQYEECFKKFIPESSQFIPMNDESRIKAIQNIFERHLFGSASGK